MAIEELGIESKKSNFFKSSLEFNLAFLLNTPPEGEEEKRYSSPHISISFAS